MQQPISPDVPRRNHLPRPPSGFPLRPLSIAVMAMGLPLGGQPIMLRPSTVLTEGTGPLDVGNYAIPCVADWNGDELPDLIVGYRYADKVALYPNVGTRSQPAFAGFTPIQAAGADINHPSVSCGAPAPWVCDYDHDGKRDLLVGTGVEGQVYFYQNTNTDHQPRLTAGVRLLANGGILSVSQRATPLVHDWDEDGRSDLLCGAGDGKVYWYRNVGTAQAPAYASRSALQAAGVDLDLGSRSVVRIGDWDGDGRKDLIGSASYILAWCRNVGSNTTPWLAAQVQLEAPESGSGLQPIALSDRNRLEVTDWNHDGILDVLVGTTDGRIRSFEGYRFRFMAIAPRTTNPFAVQWHSAEFLHYNLWAGPSLDCLCDCVASNLPSGGRITAWTNVPADHQNFFRVELAR